MSEAPSQSNLLEASITHRYPQFSLDVDFRINADPATPQPATSQPATSWTILFGPSAAGKSTLLRILAGLTTPQQGRIILNSHTLLDTSSRTAIPPGRRNIGFVPQRAALFPHRTVAENIAFGLRHLAPAERNQRIDEMLTLVDAQPLRNRNPDRLSGGESQRVAIARALAPRPRLLLLDEPLAALDAAAKPQIINCLRRSGIPILYVSHDLSEIWQLPAQTLLIEAGRITAHGPLQQVLAPQREKLLTQLH
jgi:ABC-type sulfate/molybdate transport systems ATPase subunit